MESREESHPAGGGVPERGRREGEVPQHYPRKKTELPACLSRDNSALQPVGGCATRFDGKRDEAVRRSKGKGGIKERTSSVST